MNRDERVCTLEFSPFDGIIFDNIVMTRQNVTQMIFSKSRAGNNRRKYPTSRSDINRYASEIEYKSHQNVILKKKKEKEIKKLLLAIEHIWKYWKIRIRLIHTYIWKKDMKPATRYPDLRNKFYISVVSNYFIISRHGTRAMCIAYTMDQLYSQIWREINTAGSDVEWDFFLSAMQRFNLNAYYYGDREGERRGQNRSSRVNVIAPPGGCTLYTSNGRDISGYRSPGFILIATRETIITGSNTTIWKRKKKNQLSIRKDHLKRVRTRQNSR